jgi:hypothetical protein
MAASSKAKKVSEINDLQKDLQAQTVTRDPVHTEENKVKVKFLTMICASYGTFMPGEVGEIPESYVKELVECRKCEILKD